MKKKKKRRKKERTEQTAYRLVKGNITGSYWEKEFTGPEISLIVATFVFEYSCAQPRYFLEQGTGLSLHHTYVMKGTGTS